MALYRRLLFVLSFFILVLASCTKPVLIGSDFLDDEFQSLKFKDDFGLTFFTEKTDSVQVHGELVTEQLYTYLLGELNDPLFGKSTAEIYAQPLLSSVATILKNANLDSIVLEMRYDTLGSYGSLTDPVTIEVYRMTQLPDRLQDYFSNDRFEHSSELLGSLTFVPKPEDSVIVSRPTDSTTIKAAAHIRIPLSLLLLSDLTQQDSNVYKLQDTFLAYFNGLYIRMTNASNTMLGFNLVNSVSGLEVYFRKDTLAQSKYKFVFTGGSVKTVHMEHDYSGTVVGAALSPDPETDYWYVQGMSGVTTTMRVDGLSDLDGVIVNEADLEVFCSFPDGDNPQFYPPFKYLVTQFLTDTSIENSSDVNSAIERSNFNSSSEAYKRYFGGVLEQVADGPPAIYKYEMKVTGQIKDIMSGKRENIIYFNPIDKGNVPGRSVMFGPGHPLYAPRLKVYYTKI
ncbi:MAG TPA: DUF4270 family protein [Saprospiraceae bacterium]|nr:DUF4270 family protein [Saprospiraceae bacterium]